MATPPLGGLGGAHPVAAMHGVAGALMHGDDEDDGMDDPGAYSDRTVEQRIARDEGQRRQTIQLMREGMRRRQSTQADHLAARDDSDADTRLRRDTALLSDDEDEQGQHFKPMLGLMGEGGLGAIEQAVGMDITASDPIASAMNDDVRVAAENTSRPSSGFDTHGAGETGGSMGAGVGPGGGTGPQDGASAGAGDSQYGDHDEEHARRRDEVLYGGSASVASGKRGAFQRVRIDDEAAVGDDPATTRVKERKEVCKLLVAARELRQKYQRYQREHEVRARSRERVEAEAKAQAEAEAKAEAEAEVKAEAETAGEALRSRPAPGEISIGGSLAAARAVQRLRGRGTGTGRRHTPRPKPQLQSPFSIPVPSAGAYSIEVVHGVLMVQRGEHGTADAASGAGGGDGGAGDASGNARKNTWFGRNPLHARAQEQEQGRGQTPAATSDAATEHKPQYLTSIPTAEEFFNDLREIKRIVNHGPTKSVTHKRLKLLEARFNLHLLLNSERELEEQKSVPYRDFYNVRKVDTHIHHSACMNQKHLLRFIKTKLKYHGDEVVIFRDGRFMTLLEVFHSLDMRASELSVDTLDMHASDTFHRFDRFNLKYNPCGQSRLREIFLKTDNMIAGRFLAEITQEVMDLHKQSRYQLAEWRVSIYGRKISEWDKLARWFETHRLASDEIRWMIQIPRLFFLYKRSGQLHSFQDLIDNIFAPLFAVSRDPSSNPTLHSFLHAVVGFDCVDDESRPESGASEILLDAPEEWTHSANPPYSYWCYYLWANITTLNGLRAEMGLSTFTFRPHAGEAGDPVDHLSSTYLTADGINHGILLRKCPGLQYLYYLDQIGLAVSPLSNNKLFLDYHRNPFPQLFARGLNVSLSTDDPLMLHFTKDPLVEEYSVAAQVWKMSSTDLCEIARNSVLQSGYEPAWKRHFLGEHYAEPGSQGNEIRLTNVPDIRVRYRQELLDEERSFIIDGAEASSGD